MLTLTFPGDGWAWRLPGLNRRRSMQLVKLNSQVFRAQTLPLRIVF